MTDLERSYRRLLIAYPTWYRTRRGEEILGTLLDGARPGQRHSRAGEAVHLIAHAAAVRTDLNSDGTLGALAGAAASPALASAGVFAIVVFLFGEWAPWAKPVLVPPGHFGPFLTIGPFVYLAWALAAFVDLATRSQHRRTAVVIASAVTSLAVPLGHAMRAGRPPLFVLVTLFGLGLPGLLRPDVTRNEATTRPSLLAALVTLALLAGTAVAPVLAGSRSYFPLSGVYARVAFYQTGIGVVAAWLPLAVVLLLAGAFVGVLARRQAAAGTIALIVAPWLALSAAHAPRADTANLSAVLLVAVVIVIAAVGLGHQRSARRESSPSGGSPPIVP